MPNLVDLSAGPCEICVDRQAKKIIKNDQGKPARRCDDCGKPIPSYPGHDGNGFSSATVDHEHLTVVEGKSSTSPITRELCEPCFKKDQAAAAQAVPA